MKYLILGAGPAGLTFSNILKKKGIDSFIILEKESEAGGLCRSVKIDGSPFDIGGGHFLDVRRSHVNKFLFEYMPESEWNKYNRDSRISINGAIVNHPIEANIWQLDITKQVEYLKSIAIAGCNTGKAIPQKFIDWMYWKLGAKITEEYMIPYNQKMFGNDLNQLGTYWLEKLPNVSFEESLLSCLEKKAYGNQPAHSQFYYPKKTGYGELWLRMADSLGKHIEYNKTIKGIDFSTRTVITSDGARYNADIIITTIPWAEFSEIIGMPANIREKIDELKYTSVQTEYFPDYIDTKAQWIYCPDLNLPYHRILVRHNFCSNSKGYWTETNSERVMNDGNDNNFRYMNKYAYPLNTVSKPTIMDALLFWCKEHEVIGLGRWGEHQHYNSDVTVDLAMQLAEKLCIC